MSSIKLLIVGMAVIGALALLTGTFVTVPTVLASSGTGPKVISDQKSSYIIGGYGDPCELILRR